MPARRHLRIALVALAIVLLAIFALSRPPRKPRFMDATRAAAYSNLVAVALQLVGELDQTNRAEYVARNKSTIDAGQRAIENPSERPEPSYHVENANFMEFTRVKRLGYALVAEGQIAEEQKRFREAANLYFDAIRMGERLEHGPMINFLVGTAIERGGLKPLETLLAKLPNSDLAELGPKLQDFNRDRITFPEILDREEYFMGVNATNMIDAIKTRFSARTRKMVKKTDESYLNLRAQIEIAAATMAAIRYVRENQTSLTSVESLAPKYLKTIPIDPYSNRPLVLLANSTNTPVIYSVGPNKRDDHGKSDDILPAHRDTTAGRILLNALPLQ